MITKILDLLVRYQLALVLISLACGLLFPSTFLPLNPWNTTFLQIIMFATGLRLNLGEFVHEAEDWKMLLVANGMMMVGLPILVAIPLNLFAPEWALPFVLAAAMPTGLTASAVISIIGGRTSLAVLMSVSTSMLAPFTIPLMLKALSGATVTIDTVGMMLNIAYVVILPMALALLAQWKFKRKKIEKFSNPIRLLNLLAFVCVIASVSATSAKPVDGGMASQNGFMTIGTDGLIIVILMTVFWLGIAWLTSAMLPWKNKLDRVTIAFCLIYMNTTLAVWSADTFFRDTHIAPKMVAIFIATTLILPVFKFFLPHEHRKRYHHIYKVEQT